jgi:hypothetical protein
MAYRVLILSLFGLVAGGNLLAGPVYVDGESGNDSSPGSQQEPFRTAARALRDMDGNGGEIRLVPGKAPYREPIVIRRGGTPQNPLIIDGQGAVINLGLDITPGPWTDTGEGWRWEGDLPSGFSTGLYQTTQVFINGQGLPGDHPKGPSYAHRMWHAGYVRLDDQNRLVVIFPRGLSPSNSVVVLTGKGVPMRSGVSLENASHVTLRNLTAVFASNDGFNFHGHGKDVRLENIKALFNADEGTSAHETFEVEVVESELAFNGSQGGGAQDVNSSVTRYRNVRSHQNRFSGFSLQGKSHVLDGVIGYGNGGQNIPKPAENIVVTNAEDKGAVPRGEVPEIENLTLPVSGRVEESDQLGRFLQLRPTAD